MFKFSELSLISSTVLFAVGQNVWGFIPWMFFTIAVVGVICRKALEHQQQQQALKALEDIIEKVQANQGKGDWEELVQQLSSFGNALGQAWPVKPDGSSH
jgi:hypothetical protein